MLTTPEHIAPDRTRPKTRRRGAAFPLLALLSLCAGLAIGLGSAWQVIQRDYPLGAVVVNAWSLWPRIGSREIDPYARAIIARRGDLPLGVGEGVALQASGDDTGRAFDARCIYRVARVVPQTRVWTLTVYDGRGRADAPESSLFSGGIVRAPDGSFEITLARDVQPGNWLRLPAEGPARLILRLYDTPIVSGASALDRGAVPRIDRIGCSA